MATSLCQSPTWKPFSQVQRGGWRSFAHLPAAFLFVLASLCRCFLYKECLGKVCIEPKQKREAVAYPISMGTAPWQWNPTETEDASLSLVTARHCLWLGPLWHKCTPMYLYIIKRFQSKTITQKMHWGRGWEQAGARCLTRSFTNSWRELSCTGWVSTDTGAPQGAEGYHCQMLSQNIEHLSQNGTALWGCTKKPFQIFRAQPILWIVASLGAFILWR